MKKLIALVAALVMVSSFAYAADWNFYGSARVSTWWTSTDAQTPGVADVDQFSQALQGNSRIGANVNVSDELTGRFEYGTGVNVRILWGEWNFGSGSFGVGQNYTPLNLSYSNQVYNSDTDLDPYGGVYSGRAPMLRLKFGGFQIAAVAPATAGVTTGLVDGAVTAAVAPGTGIVTYTANLETDDWGSAENSFPAIEAYYSFKMDAFSADIAAGYQTYELKNAAGLTADYDSYVVAIGGRYNFGMGYINANYYMGQNAGNLISLETGGPVGTAAGIEDVDNTGYRIILGAKLNDMFAVEGGYGYAQSDFDTAGMADDEVTSYYVNSTITLAPGVMVIPEVGVIDQEEAGTDKVTYLGAKWQINF